MTWMITNKTEPELSWSNDDGWGVWDEGCFTVFTDEDRQTLNLPIDGEWCVIAP